MIAMKNLTKKYGESVILENADYVFPPTGIVCLMGPSGGGKTTLFNLLAGFDTDYQGEITVGGTKLNGMTPDALCAYRRDCVGFVFQNYHLLPGYTALENVMIPCEVLPYSREEGQKTAQALLARLGLEGKEHQNCETLSGGQKQRVAIARALMGNPKILFADEPTGALDRKTSTDIMALLREISAEKLVVVITHDPKICSFADEIIQIKDGKISSKRTSAPAPLPEQPLSAGRAATPRPMLRAAKNCKVHLKRYLAVSLAISLGLLAFLFSLSFGNVMNQSIAAFQEKNTALGSGYLRGDDDGTLLAYLQGDPRIETAYYQYKLEQVSLTLEGVTQVMEEKFPGAKATQPLSYGVMPRRGAGEISLSPSLAKKFSPDLRGLLGKQLLLRYGGQEYPLTVSGIFNADYDDFFLSADVEQQLYQGLAGQERYSITYEVPLFDHIVAVDNALALRGVAPQSAAAEVYALQRTFRNLNRLFLIISSLVLAVGLFICTILLVRLQNSRYHEVGLLAALGFGRRHISAIIAGENILLALLAAGVALVLLGGSAGVAWALQLPFGLKGTQVGLAMAATFGVVLLLSGGASVGLLRTESAAALRH